MHNFVVMHSFFLSILFIVMLVECCQSAWCEKNPQKTLTQTTQILMQPHPHTDTRVERQLPFPCSPLILYSLYSVSALCALRQMPIDPTTHPVLNRISWSSNSKRELTMVAHKKGHSR